MLDKAIKMFTAWRVFIIVVLAVWKCHGQTYPFMNTSLSFEDRVKVEAVGILCVVIAHTVEDIDAPGQLGASPLQARASV